MGERKSPIEVLFYFPLVFLLKSDRRVFFRVEYYWLAVEFGCT